MNLSKGWGSRIESVHPYGYIINTDINYTDYSNTDFSESETLADTDYEELVYEFGREEVDYQIRKIKEKHYKGCMNKATIAKWCKERQVTVAPPKKKNKFTDFPQTLYKAGNGRFGKKAFSTNNGRLEKG